MNRPAVLVARATRVIGAVCLAAAASVACSEGRAKAFVISHDAIRPGMSLREVFDAGLADYLESMGTKNVPGATLPDKQPASSACKRHVLDIAFSGGFRVRVYCGMNSPTASELVPMGEFKDKQALLQALDQDYASWAANMEFRVESPPREIFGIYDHYRFVTDAQGRIIMVSPVIVSRSGG